MRTTALRIRIDGSAGKRKNTPMNDRIRMLIRREFLEHEAWENRSRASPKSELLEGATGMKKETGWTVLSLTSVLYTDHARLAVTSPMATENLDSATPIGVGTCRVVDNTSVRVVA